MIRNRARELYEKRKQSGHTKLKQQIIEHCGTVCANCGSSQEIEYHHIVPLSNGGTNRVSNYVALCSVCHLKAHGKLKYRNVWSCENEIKIDKPDNVNEVINKFLNGELSKGDICQEWGIRQDTTLHRISFFRRYLERHEIVSYKNFVDLVKNRRANTATDDQERIYLASIIIFYDGTEERYYRTMKNGCIVKIEKETIKGEVDE